MDGGTPVTRSTSGRGMVGKNWRAYGVSVSRKRRCPSANTTSNASELLPEPLGPVTTVSLPCGISTDTSLRLCSRARTTLKLRFPTARADGRRSLAFAAPFFWGFCAK